MSALSALVIVCQTLALAEIDIEPDIRAAFLNNFVRFVEWPADALAAGDPITVCVVGSRAVAESLRKAAKGRPVDGHDVLVVAASDDEALRTCHLVYLSGHDEKRARRTLRAVEGAAVFTVGDWDRFAAIGGVANFFVDQSRVRFAVNIAASRRHRLRLSSKMLTLATLVNDGS
jgi:hypothetical protein